MNASLPDFLSRVTLAMQKANMTKSDLARACGVSPQYLSNWFNARTGRNLPPAEVCYRIAQALNVDLVWLIAGLGTQEAVSNILVVAEGDPIPEGYVSIPQYQVEFACGAHTGDSIEPMYDELTNYEPAIYKKSWIESQGANPKNCKRFIVHGNSMCPVICSGDCILVDTSYEARTRIKSRGIYAIFYDGSLLCKYLTPRISGGLILSSEDQVNYPPEVIDATSERNFFVVGKVLERSGKMSNYIS